MTSRRNRPPRLKIENLKDRVPAVPATSASVKVAQWAYEAQRLADEGRTNEARAALANAEIWRKRSGL